MTLRTVFSKKIVGTKSKTGLIVKTLKRIIANNKKLFLLCSLLAVMTSTINFNIAVNLKRFINSPSNIDASKSILEFDKFKFTFRLLWKEWSFKNLNIFRLGVATFILVFLLKSIFSLLHFYLMSYSYDSVEKELKRDLFNHFIRSRYTNSSKVSKDLITKFSSDLDSISYNIWFIPNRLIYVLFTIFLFIKYDFNFGEKVVNLKLLLILFSIFSFLIFIETYLFKKAAKLGVEAKKRYEKDNKMIYERINNLEYIKSVSGENYEEEKLQNQLNDTFRKNRVSLWYTTLFKAFPNYSVIPNIPYLFTFISIFFSSKNDSFLIIKNFISYFQTVQKLNNEMNKIIDSLLGLDELSSNLSLVNENVKTLQKNNENQQVDFSEKGGEKFEYQRGKDLVFENVTFAYPERSYRDILIDFSFRFKKGKIYGIAGQNGIGKSTITKTTLKLYEAKKGRIKIGGRDIRNINTKDLQKNICHQTNRPNFFNMSIAENVFYPNVYIKERDYEIMLYAARKACIDEFILKLSKGFDTVLKEGGTDLSEGQKQQISAMKIFIDEYDLYILDEILSNVHPLIRRRILDNIFKKVSGKTVLVIDHHYEIFKYVDEIYKFTGRNLLKENGIMIEKEKAKEKQNE